MKRPQRNRPRLPLPTHPPTHIQSQVSKPTTTITSSKMMKRVALVLASLAVATAHYTSEYNGKVRELGEDGRADP